GPPSTISVPESATFSLAVGQAVYAGFTSATSITSNGSPVDFSGNNDIGTLPGLDSHFAPGYDTATGHIPVVVGDMFVENGGGGNGTSSSSQAFELGRTYHFSETLSFVPEPASLGLLV